MGKKKKEKNEKLEGCMCLYIYKIKRNVLHDLSTQWSNMS